MKIIVTGSDCPHCWLQSAHDTPLHEHHTTSALSHVVVQSWITAESQHDGSAIRDATNSPQHKQPNKPAALLSYCWPHLCYRGCHACMRCKKGTTAAQQLLHSCYESFFVRHHHTAWRHALVLVVGPRQQTACKPDNTKAPPSLPQAQCIGPRDAGCQHHAA